MSEIRQDGFARIEEAIEDARAGQTDEQRHALLLTQRAETDALGGQRRRLQKMRLIAARRRTGMQLQARFAATRAAADRARGSRSMKLLDTLKPRKQAQAQDKAEKHEKQHGEHKTHADHRPDAHRSHEHQAHCSREGNPERGVERLDRDGGRGSGRQQHQQKDRQPVVKVKLSKRIAPSAIRSDLRHLADSHADQPMRLETQTRLAWTRTCLGFGDGLSREPNAAVTPVVLGSSLDLISARLQHAPLRDGTRQTGLLGVKHQLQTVQDEPGYRAPSASELSSRQKDLNLLKPLLVLHGERPYTRTQLRLSVCRIRTLLFATGNVVDSKQAMRTARTVSQGRTHKWNAPGASKHDATRAANDASNGDPGSAS